MSIFLSILKFVVLAPLSLLATGLFLSHFNFNPSILSYLILSAILHYVLSTAVLAARCYFNKELWWDQEEYLKKAGFGMGLAVVFIGLTHLILSWMEIKGTSVAGYLFYAFWLTIFVGGPFFWFLGLFIPELRRDPVLPGLEDEPEYASRSTDASKPKIPTVVKLGIAAYVGHKAGKTIAKW